MLFIASIFTLVFSLSSAAKTVERTATTGLRSTQLTTDKGSGSDVSSILRDTAESLDQTVIICNAYASSKPVEVTNLRRQVSLTEGTGLTYKSCRDFHIPLQDGDRLEFASGNISVGIFRATGLPKAKCTLLLVMHRREENSLSAAFESHAFAPANGPQVAVVDAYKGREASKVKIADAAAAANGQTRTEELRFNAVASLGAGNYEVLLQDGKEKEIAKLPLQVTDQQANYVVIRTGLQRMRNVSATAFPQELVVYGEQAIARSSAGRLQWSMMSPLLVILAGLAGLVF